MRQALTLFAAGILALIAQGALAGQVAYPICPDLGLLVVVAIGLYWEPLPSGFALAAALGYATDALSGSLLGQHALLRLLSFAAARLGGRQLNLRGSLPLAVFAGGLTLGYGIALQATTAFFTGGSAAGLVAALGRLLVHALVNAACAPMVAYAVGWLCAVSGDEDTRRSLRLGARVGGAA